MRWRSTAVAPADVDQADRAAHQHDVHVDRPISEHVARPAAGPVTWSLSPTGEKVFSALYHEGDEEYQQAEALWRAHQRRMRFQVS
jgi:hypothetical protein